MVFIDCGLNVLSAASGIAVIFRSSIEKYFVRSDFVDSEIAIMQEEARAAIR